jgi:hypothetical protein
LVLALVGGGQAFGKIGFRQLTSTHPVAIQRGKTAELKVRTNFTLDGAYQVMLDRPGVTMKCLETEPIKAPRQGRGSKGTPFRFETTADADVTPGVFEFRIATEQAVSSVGQLLVTDFPVVVETSDENGRPESAQVVELPAAVCGICEKFEDVDCYKFRGSAGQPITIDIYAQRVTDRIHSMVVKGPRIYLMDPILTLIGPNGQVVAQNDNFRGGDALVACELPADGEYALEVRDARFAGDLRYSYCVEISEQPRVFGFHPMAVQQGATSSLEVIGHGLGGLTKSDITAGDAAGWRQRQVETPRGRSNFAPLKISPHKQLVESANNDVREQAQKIDLPVGLNGRMEKPQDIDFFRFTAKKGVHYRFQVEARRFGSPIDAVVELYDVNGRVIAEADDFPKHHTKDSRLDWTAPGDGPFTFSIRDLHDEGGRRYTYHISVEEALPDFDLFGEYYYAMLSPGVRMIWFARIDRLNGFEGPVEIEVEGLPAGVDQTPVTIPTGMNHCAVILNAKPDAPIGAALVRIRGRATTPNRHGEMIDIVRDGYVTCEQQSSGGGQSRWPIQTQVVGVTKPLDLIDVTASPAKITLKRGETAEIEVTIERAAEFKDAVTLDMEFKYFANVLGAQLPPGVKMSSKSKARLTGDNLTGKIVLEATDKATLVEDLPIAVLARVSITFSITTNYASTPILLTVSQ